MSINCSNENYAAVTNLQYFLSASLCIHHCLLHCVLICSHKHSYW